MFAATVKQPLKILVQLQMFCAQALKECEMDVGINMSATDQHQPRSQLHASSRVHTSGFDQPISFGQCWSFVLNVIADNM